MSQPHNTLVWRSRPFAGRGESGTEQAYTKLVSYCQNLVVPASMHAIITASSSHAVPFQSLYIVCLSLHERRGTVHAPPPTCAAQRRAHEGMVVKVKDHTMFDHDLGNK